MTCLCWAFMAAMRPFHANRVPTAARNRAAFPGWPLKRGL